LDEQVSDHTEDERRQSASPGTREIWDGLEIDPLEAGGCERTADGRRVIADADQRMGIGGGRL
jgi:hypothetical protein